MGVRARVVFPAVAPANRLRDAAGAALDRIARLEAILSDWREDSELSHLPERASAGPAAVSEDLFRALGIARDLAVRTRGAFDPTLGALTRLWREARKSGRLAPAGEIDRARRCAGWWRLHLDPRARTARIDGSGLRLDLGGMGKGFAAGEAVHLLRERGLPSCLVAIGGDIVAGEAPPGSRGWKVRFETGLAGGEGDVWLANGAIATSGDREQTIEIAGVRQAHLLDPRTGLGRPSPAAAMVLAGDGATADGVATALCVTGVAGAPALLRAFPGVEALVLELAGDEKKSFATPGFPGAGSAWSRRPGPGEGDVDSPGR